MLLGYWVGLMKKTAENVGYYSKGWKEGFAEAEVKYKVSTSKTSNTHI